VIVKGRLDKTIDFRVKDPDPDVEILDYSLEVLGAGVVQLFIDHSKEGKVTGFTVNIWGNEILAVQECEMIEVHEARGVDSEPVLMRYPSTTQLLSWMENAGWSDVDERYEDMQRVERVVLAALSMARGGHRRKEEGE